MATSTAAQAEYPFAAGTDTTGRAQAVSDAAGLVLIESPEYPRGLWVDLVDETGQALAGIQVAYQGVPDSMVAIWSVDPSGLRQETLLWTRPVGNSLSLSLKSGEPAVLPAGLTSIDWRVDPKVEGQLEPNRLVGWGAMAGFIRENWRCPDGMLLAVRFDDSSMSVSMDRAESIETMLRHLQETDQQAIETLAETPVFGAAVHQSSFAPTRGDSGNQLVRGWKLRSSLEGDLGALVWPNDPTCNRFGDLAGDRGEEHPQSGGCWALDRPGIAGSVSNQIVDVGSLASLTNLKELHLADNQIVDVSPLSSLTNLEKLDLYSNDLADVRPMASLSRLRFLYLDDNGIVDVSPLATLTRLERLTVMGNEIVDVGPLSALTNLEVLVLRSNEIEDVGPLSAMTNLWWLDLEDNQIQDISPLVANSGLVGGMDEVKLGRNPLSDQAINEQIPALEARGVTVRH